MNIEHVAILYCDLERAKCFFEDYFGASAGKLYRNEKTGFSSYFLTFDNGCRLEIMNRLDIEASKEKNALGLAHIAFSVGSKQAVDELTERLRNDGYTIKGEPRVTGDGYYESVISDCEGNTIEITV